MAKVAPLMFLVALLLLSSSLVLTSARPEPPFREDATPVKTKLPAGTNMEEGGGSCEGVEDESEECLMRSTLAAHLDYIYTQKQKP